MLSHGAAAPPTKKHSTQWASSSVFTPSVPGHNLSVRNRCRFWVKSDRALPVKVIRCHGFTSSAGPRRAIITTLLCQSSPVQMANFEIPPQQSCGRCWSANSPAVSKRQNLLPAMWLVKKRSGTRSDPVEAPQEQWQSFREPLTECNTKAHTVPKLQLLPQHKTGECKFGFFHLNPLTHCKCGERVRTLACHSPIPLPSVHAALVTARWQFMVGLFDFIGRRCFLWWKRSGETGSGGAWRVSTWATVPALSCFAWMSQNFSCSGQPDEQHKSLVSQVFTVFFLFPFSHGLCGQQHKIPRHSHLNTSFLFMLSVAFMFSC